MKVFEEGSLPTHYGRHGFHCSSSLVQAISTRPPFLLLLLFFSSPLSFHAISTTPFSSFSSSFLFFFLSSSPSFESMVSLSHFPLLSSPSFLFCFLRFSPPWEIPSLYIYSLFKRKVSMGDLHFYTNIC